MNSAMVGYIAAAIGVPLVFLLLRKLFPSLAVSKTPEPSSTESSKKFCKWDFFTAVCFFLLAGVTGYIWWVVFSKIELLNAFRFEHAIISVTPTGYVWAFPAMLAAMGSGIFMTDRLLKSMLKNRYSEYASYQNAKYGINADKLGTPIYLILSGVTLIMLVMLSNWYTLFTSDEVIVKRLFAFSKDKFKYSEVSHIVTAPSLTAPNGKVVNRREYVIKFASGTSWTTNLAPTDLTLDQKLHIAQFVSRTSGVPITEVKRLTRDELY